MNWIFPIRGEEEFSINQFYMIHVEHTGLAGSDQIAVRICCRGFQRYHISTCFDYTGSDQYVVGFLSDSAMIAYVHIDSRKRVVPGSDKDKETKGIVKKRTQDAALQ